MKQLEAELDQLRSRGSEMGIIAEKMVSQVAVAVVEPQKLPEVFQEVMTDEQRLDEMQVEIDNEAVRVLSLFSPVASDLRFVFSITRVAAELERIGDHTKNICRSLQLMRNKGDIAPIKTVQKMAKHVEDAVKDAMLAYVRRDSSLARNTISSDEVVDVLNEQVINEMLHDDLVRRSIEMPIDLAAAMSQILLARSLERIGDQATNICEEVVYMVQGDDIRHQG